MSWTIDEDSEEFENGSDDDDSPSAKQIIEEKYSDLIGYVREMLNERFEQSTATINHMNMFYQKILDDKAQVIKNKEFELEELRKKYDELQYKFRKMDDYIASVLV